MCRALPGAPQGVSHPNVHVLETGSWGAAVVDELVQDPSDIRIDKCRMSGFTDTCLDSVLRNLGINTPLFAGVNADQCVLATLMQANFLGYDCVLLQDCAATTSSGKNLALADIAAMDYCVDGLVGKVPK